MSLLHGVGDFFAIDIGTNSIRLIQLGGDAQRGWTLEKYAYVPIDAAMAMDDSAAGRRKMGETILGAVKQAGFKTKNVVLGLPARKTYTAIIEVPNGPEKSVANAMKYGLDQYIPMPIEEAKVDFAVLGVSPNDPLKAEVLVSSTEAAYAEQKMEELERLGLNVVAQEPEPIAMARALAPMSTADGVMLIDLGERSADLVVVYDKVPRLVRSIPGGLQLLTQTVAERLEVDRGMARQYILKYGLAQDKVEGRVFKALDSVLENFAVELTKSVKFFQNKYTKTKVSSIVLSGFAGVIPFIAEYIEVRTNVPSVQGNPWQYVRVTEQQQQALLSVASEFGVAIGLAERSND